MTRSRLVVLAASLVVLLGVLGGAGALYLDPARAAVGPLPPEALAFPAETRFVMGLDMKRFVASPFYARMAARAEAAGKPRPFADLEAKTGLSPERDIDQIVAAGARGQEGARKPQGVVLVLGRFDRYKLARAIETEGRSTVTTKTVQGTTVYLFEESRSGEAKAAVAFVDDGALVLGSQGDVEHVISARGRGEATLRGNAELLTLVESVRPGSTFWVAGDQTALQNMPKAIPGPGASGTSQSIELPALKSVIVTGDLDPEVALDVTGEAADEAAARNLADVVRGFVALASLQAGQKPELKQLASAVSVTTEATRVRVNARFPYELLDTLERPRGSAAR